jgi:hypothetical protein
MPKALSAWTSAHAQRASPPYLHISLRVRDRLSMTETRLDVQDQHRVSPRIWPRDASDCLEGLDRRHNRNFFTSDPAPIEEAPQHAIAGVHTLLSQSRPNRMQVEISVPSYQSGDARCFVVDRLRTVDHQPVFLNGHHSDRASGGP